MLVNNSDVLLSCSLSGLGMLRALQSASALKKTDYS